MSASPVPSLFALEAPIVAVTVLEDRASVTRRGSVVLQPGVARIEVPRVAPVLVDKSVTVSVSAESPVRVIDVRPRRRWVTSLERDGETDPDRGALRKELRQRDEALNRLDQRRTALRARLAALGRLADRTADDLAEDVSWGAFPVETAAAVVRVEDQQSALVSELVTVERDLGRLAADRARLSKRLDVTASPQEFQSAWLEIDVDADAPCQALVQVEYLVPCAVWRPYHTAELERDAGVVTLSTDACVWQHTGEDWTDVALTLSTARASLGSDPPELRPDPLLVRKRRDVITVAARSQTVEVLAGAGAGARAQGLPGIDDADEAQHLRAPDPVTIPSDGRPHRVRIGGFTSDADVERVCAAELVLAAVLESHLTNVGPAPLLAGPVDLVLDGGYVGRTSVGYAEVGERFALGWGPDGDLRVSRDEQRRHTDAKVLRAFETIEKTVTLRLSNLSSTPRVVVLKERVPVSELPDKVKIEVDADGTSDGVTPDRDGILRWDVELGPFGMATRTLVYAIRKHQDVRGL